MDQNVDQMMTGRPRQRKRRSIIWPDHAKDFAIDHVRDERQWDPSPMVSSKGPFDASPGYARGDIGVLIDLLRIVVINKTKMSYLEITDNDQQ